MCVRFATVHRPAIGSDPVQQLNLDLPLIKDGDGSRRSATMSRWLNNRRLGQLNFGSILLRQPVPRITASSCGSWRYNVTRGEFHQRRNALARHQDWIFLNSILVPVEAVPFAIEAGGVDDRHSWV